MARKIRNVNLNSQSTLSSHKSNEQPNNTHQSINMSRFLITAIMALAVLAPRVLGESQSPSFAPSSSPAPSYIDVEQFEWDIEPARTAEVSLTEASNTTEIKLFYNISIRDTKIQAFESDCTTPIPSIVTTLSSETVITSPTHANFTIRVDIAQKNIMNYPGVWMDVGVGEGLISMCIRLDLTLGDVAETSVNFHETVMDVSVGLLLQGFEVINIDLDRLNATEVTDSVDLDYNVTAFQCDDNGDVSNEVLTQGSDVFLCVETTASNVEIAEIRELIMTQGAFSTTPIVAGIEDTLTLVTIFDKEAIIRYQVVSQFFADPSPDNIVATGSVILAFTDDSGRRRAKVVPAVPSRDLELEDAQVEEEGFSLEMAVCSANPPESSGTCANVASFITSLICTLVIGGAVAMA
jgi:hypothetical protein